MDEQLVESWMTPIGPEVPYLGRAFAGALSLLGRTWRFHTVGAEHEAAARRVCGRIIYALWHGRLLTLAFAYRGRGVRTLVSRHRDGEILAHALESLGYEVRRGSSRRRGTAAFLGLLEEARRGDVAITPDGPRGPAGALAPGVLHLAQRSGLPILPVSCTASSSWRIGTWDRILLPRPFARVTIQVGRPVLVPRDAGPDQLRKSGVELCDSLESLSRGGLPGEGPA